MSKVRAVAEKIKDGKSLSLVTQRVLSLASERDGDAEKVTDTLKRDPVLASKVVRAANSSWRAMFSKVPDVDGAVERVGVRSVRDMVRSFSTHSLVDTPRPADESGYSNLGVWQHSAAVALMAELLTQYSESAQVRSCCGQAVLAGLTHDIGIILADQHMGEKYRSIPPSAHFFKNPLFKSEKEAFGFSHSALGAEVLKRWKIPTPVVQAVAWHHKPDKYKHEPLTQLTATAELLVSSMGGVGYSDMVVDVPKAQLGDLLQRVVVLGPQIDNVKRAYQGQLSQVLEVFE